MGKFAPMGQVLRNPGHRASEEELVALVRLQKQPHDGAGLEANPAHTAEFGGGEHLSDPTMDAGAGETNGGAIPDGCGSGRASR